MSLKVSVSKKGQSSKPPTRAERDAASSSGAGRMAVEESISEELQANRADPQREKIEDEPIGLEMETVGDLEDHHR